MSTKVLIVSVIIVIVLAAMLYFSFAYRVSAPSAPEETKAPTSSTVPAVGTTQTAGDLGGSIYQNASNPVSGKLPSTAAPVPNPIDSAYKNPFE